MNTSASYSHPFAAVSEQDGRVVELLALTVPKQQYTADGVRYVPTHKQVEQGGCSAV